MGKINRSTKPIKMWIDGTAFSIPKFETRTAFNRNLPTNSDLNLQQEHNFILTEMDNRFTTSFCLPPVYYVGLNNFPYLSRRKIEVDTRTVIRTPQRDDGSMTISGDCADDVVNARRTVQSIVAEIRNKQPAAQFISIPVNSEEVQRNFQQFKDAILSAGPIEGVEDSVFQSPLKLHLTICVFVLLSPSEKEEAVKALNDCKTEVLDTFLSSETPLKVHVAGIDCMNDNHSKVNVLYANAKIVQDNNEEVLQKLANAISDYFYNRGLLIQYTDNVRLHVTLMNTKYRSKSAQNTPKRSRWPTKRIPFNATSIIEKYKDFYFGEKVLDSIHLSCMSSKGEDGFYAPLSVIRF
ncbi:activating signal cointegrator 1 complex subunit 1-like isoform X2 [Photinus pyralis]|uniref:A-kinase anchor protein 7-like phosphoesterase domain-containing protein n=1 Tax=Photinus pyralis TaxID=7054 RepID=A0A1Y1N1C7_PHOPY|nr:activating signal cointegrator 1 complex subunit 1-like isoform X2 [Photinus pyralis]XP_031350375.1 activating signal cointegrator 1 complex subunit 1-like isoform X2 [Photinus pyralis]